MRIKKVKGANEIIIKGKYYIENPENYKGIWQSVFQNSNPIHLEIGMGKGQFLIESAIKNPNINYIGIEKFDSILVRAVQKSNDLELSNLKLIRTDANFLENIFSNEISTIYLNFSDPWPKDRHYKRRLTSTNFLNIYDKIFKDKHHIIMKTDNICLFNFSIDSLSEYGYKIINKNNNFYRLNNLDNIMTEYEEKFLKLGIKINRLEAIKEDK